MTNGTQFQLEERSGSKVKTLVEREQRVLATCGNEPLSSNVLDRPCNQRIIPRIPPTPIDFRSTHASKTDPVTPYQQSLTLANCKH